MLDHGLCRGHTFQDDPTVEFNEQHKQQVLDKVASLYHWGLAWDIDETFETEAAQLMPQFHEQFANFDYVSTRWLNIWGKSNLIRIDGLLAEGRHVKFYNLKSGRWVFDNPITNGAKLVGRGVDDTAIFKECRYGISELVCLHWGLMTHELRIQHKERWDRIYSIALRGDKNPYGFWNYVLDPSINPITVKHGYLQ
jgi:hypothetical protein